MGVVREPDEACTSETDASRRSAATEDHCWRVSVGYPSGSVSQTGVG